VIAEKSNSIRLIGRIVIQSLIVVFFWSFVGQYIPTFAHVQSTVCSIDSSQPTTGKSYNVDLSDCGKNHVDLKVVEESEEEEVHHPFSGNQPFRLQSMLLVRYETTSISLFSPGKIIKLYILFHSWRSFLDFQ
jgi:hypothetical protein